MTDIGLGLVDRRTVIVVLISIVLAFVVLGFSPPIDTSNAFLFFADIVLLTGYLYLARTIYRFPLAIITFGIAIILHLSWGVKRISSSGAPRARYSARPAPPLQVRLIRFLDALAAIPLLVISSVVFIVNFGKLRDKNAHRSSHMYEFLNSYFVAFVSILLGILDRVGLIFVTVFATVPTYQSSAKELGVPGLILMLVIYVFRGNFTAIVRDFIEQQEQSSKE